MRGRVPILSKKELSGLGPKQRLDEGGFGIVTKLVYEGKEAVMKELKAAHALHPLLREARLMVEVGGAGGVPQVLALCLHPPAMVQEFVGETYATYMKKCSVGGALDSLVAIAHRLQEVHGKGVVHNDVYEKNITYTGDVHQPVFHLIDLGLSCHVGQIPGKCLFQGRDTPQEVTVASGPPHPLAAGDHDYRTEGDLEGFSGFWQAPEVLLYRPVFPSSDVYGFGVLMQNMAFMCSHTFLTDPLRDVAKSCIFRDPRRRCSLARVTQAITALRDTLRPHQLNASLICWNGENKRFTSKSS